MEEAPERPRNRCRTDDQKENEPKCVGHEMALAAFHQFIGVETFFATHFCRCDTLTVNNPNTWLGVSTGLGPYIAAEKRVDVVPCAIITPSSIIIPNVIPGRKIARQHPPLTAGPDAIEDRVQYFADVDRSLLA